MTSVPFLPAADKEFRDAFTRYRSIRPALASDFLAEVEYAARRAATFPLHGSPFLRGTRRILLKRFPFSLVYVTESDVTVVVALAHYRRKPGYWIGRLRKGLRGS